MLHDILLFRLIDTIMLETLKYNHPSAIIGHEHGGSGFL